MALGPFAEAVRATFQPCTFLLIVPAVVTSIVLRNRRRTVVAMLAASIVGGWLLAANRFVLDGVWVRLTAAIVGVALLAMALPQVRDAAPGVTRPNVEAAVGGGVVLLATMWWRPCVGNELGTILTGAQDGMASQLFPMAAYMLGAMSPVVLVALAHHTLEPSERATRLASWGALAIGVVVAVSLVAGQHDRVVVALTRWTIG